MKPFILIGLMLFTGVFNVTAQDSVAYYGLKLPTEEELKSIPYTPAFGLPEGVVLPRSKDISNQMPPIGNQGKQGSCTAFATSYALKSYHVKKRRNWEYQENGQIKYDRVCSPSFVFNTIKRAKNDPDCESGISFVEAFDVLQKIGTLFWAEFPYDQSNCTKLPAGFSSIASKAASNKISTFRIIYGDNIVDEVRYNLFLDNPVIIGVILDASFQKDGFEANKNNSHFTYVPKGFLDPNKYHAMICVGYDHDRKTFKVMNSWGESWGNKGFVDIPYEWFKKIVLEAYIMHDNYDYGMYAEALKSQGKDLVPTQRSEEIITDTSIAIPSNTYSSWFKKGYYRVIDELKFGLTHLDNDKKIAIVKVSDNATNEVINTLVIKENETQTIHWNNEKISFSFDDIKRAGKNPLNKAAFFTVSVEESIAPELNDKFDKLELLKNQKVLIDQLMQQQKVLIER